MCNWLKNKTVKIVGLDKDGYIRVMNNGKYVSAHRLIMGKHMGRELTSDENVHHINGVRHDNRVENLEIWSTSQPSGQRVSDKIRWAREIIDKYAS